MGATGRNIVKFITGSAIGAGIGALIARGAESTAEQGPSDIRHTADSGDDSTSVKEKFTKKRESLRDRWARAQAEGEAAKEAREAELRAYFREKVKDPTAFPPGAPTRSDT